MPTEYRVLNVSLGDGKYMLELEAVETDAQGAVVASATARVDGTGALPTGAGAKAAIAVLCKAQGIKAKLDTILSNTKVAATTKAITYTGTEIA